DFACANSCLKPNVVRSPVQMTTSGSRSLISPIARSMRLGMKCGPPQWMSEMCAIVKVRSAPGMGRSVRLSSYKGAYPKPLLPFLDVASETPDFQAYRGEGTPRFANDAELECAKLLDFYRVPWQYEPRTFVLEEDENGTVVEAFKPDFYLPD